jgi:hypothetical protein
LLTEPRVLLEEGASAAKGISEVLIEAEGALVGPLLSARVVRQLIKKDPDLNPRAPRCEPWR